MKILVLGSGGREHALVWKFVRDGHTVTCAPGNAGIARLAECAGLDPEQVVAAADFAEAGRFDLTVVGPEGPLVRGIGDEFVRRGLPVFGPNRAGAQLEGSKAFAKELMQECGIPTARFAVFTSAEQALEYARGHEYPLVIKASGLALGKGAVIVNDHAQAAAVINQMLVEKTFGSAGDEVLIEEFLAGEEASLIGITDGTRVLMLVPSQDHKALLDGDQGPNTGGMGAYAPAPIVTSEIRQEVLTGVFDPLLRGLKQRGIVYRGVVYAGLMLTANGPAVLEFNCRFGDPETQAILPLFEGDLARVLLQAAQGRLPDTPLEPAGQRYALCVVAASAGYPGAYQKGLAIAGDLRDSADALVFHAGTRLQSGRVVTNGGRVLGVTGMGDSLAAAQESAYRVLSRIRFPGMQFRTDIGARGMRRLAGQS